MNPMRAVMSMVMLTTLIVGVRDPEAAYWIGRHFLPHQCVMIQEGRYQEVKHKLCTITYDIRNINTLYRIDGRIQFDETIVPPTVSEVEIQVLFMDESLVCRKQMNLQATVENRHATFSIVAENIPSNRYVKTNYFIYHR